MSGRTIGRGQLCDSCGSATSKYRCPGCSTLSCSLSCVKRHKLEHGCSGLRYKTAFVPLNEFNDNHLYSDYYFLEDVGRCVDLAHRGLVHNKRELDDSKATGRRFHWLKREALQRGTKLLLTEGMSQHRANSSYTVRVSGHHENGQRKNGTRWEIYWCLQLHFPHVELEFLEGNVAESVLLSEVLDKYIHPTSSDPIVRHQLSAYVAFGPEVEVLLKDASQPASQRYHRLKKKLSLCENFAGKTIIEFPKLIVVLGSQLTDYCLTESPSVKETSTNPTSADMLPQLQVQPTPQDLKRVPQQHYPDSEWSGDEEDDSTGLKLIAQSYGDSSFSDEG